MLRGKGVLGVGIVLIVAGAAILGLGGLAAKPAAGKASVTLYTTPYLVSAAYKAYGNERLGFWVAKVVIQNTGEGPIHDVSVSYKIEGLTDWSEPHTYAAIAPGGAVVDLYYPKIMSMPQLQASTPSTVYVKVEYKPSPGAEPVVVRKSRQISILGLHDFIFSSLPPEENTGSFRDLFNNAPLLAAWVTYTDPVLQRYADMANKLSGGAGATLSDNAALRFLDALWTLSVENGITYQTEPTSYWTGRSSQYVKYPRDVLKDKSGTCLDTTIFIAAAAMSHGLKAYILLMPRHALPIIELPSGALVAIESTLLNARTTLRQAIQAGTQNAQRALQGPHIIVDVALMHSLGVSPPELPQLPPDVLERWGYALPAPQPPPQGGGNEGGGNQGGGEGQGGGFGAGEGGEAGGQGQLVVLSNPLGDPPWSLRIPRGWSVEEHTDEEPFEVDVYSNARHLALAVIWSNTYSVAEMREYIESLVEDSFGAVSIAGENRAGSLGSYRAVTVAYNTGDGGLMVARYASINGYTYAVLYLIGHEDLSDETISFMENIVGSFRVG